MMNQPEWKPQKKVSLKLMCVLLAAAVLVSGALTGIAGWKLAEKQAKEEMQTYIEEKSVSRYLTYQRLSESWNRTLGDVYGDVIFFGDSLTAEGLWNEYFPYLTTVNLGVVGDDINCLMVRLPQVETLMCQKCFLMIGVNELAFLSTVENALADYDLLLQDLARMSEETGMQVYVQSVLPVQEDVTIYSITNQDIRDMNKGIEALAEKYDMTYIDVHSSFADESGNMIESFCFDGLHLTEAGYQTWAEVLSPYVDE